MAKEVRRIFVEKKAEFAVEAQHLLEDLQHNLGLTNLNGVRILHRYDIEDIEDKYYDQAVPTVFSEPPVDLVYQEDFPRTKAASYFGIESLPGQFDQRADSASQCLQLLTGKERPLIKAAKIIGLEGDLTAADLEAVKKYCINTVAYREAALVKPDSLAMEIVPPAPVEILQGFITYTSAQLQDLWKEMDLAMSLADFAFCQDYFKNQEQRDPSMTEIKVIDTYWSDHCRHTTFSTKITAVTFEPGYFTTPIEETYQEYLACRQAVYGQRQKSITLMDIATVAMKAMKQQGILTDLDDSEEINACSIKVKVQVNETEEDWLVMFKNETHNHPTEIEPFGGAATCLGGSIRDPLSGRAYVYQAMRVTGSGDPRTPIAQTLAGKLPQRKITKEAAAGYSSYGNQIGLATGQVCEYYDDNFVAKRMEVGAVIAAAPAGNVQRFAPIPGDVVLLLGGQTGRDGCGGATGSSKQHTEESLATCGAEVQKGNAPTERKLQRLFRNPQASVLIKRCNDFGAGGVAVAIGELTEGLEINLDRVPKKYEGLDGTELAISESQERMAVVVAAGKAAEFMALAEAENLEATIVAEVTDHNRLVMSWNGTAIVDLSRDFLNTNGVEQETTITVATPDPEADFFLQTPTYLDTDNLKADWLANLAQLHTASQKGLAENFDSTIGAGTILMPFGGQYQLTPTLGMAAKIPVLQGETTTATLMTHGYNPLLAKWSPYHGAIYSVVESIAKVVAMGGNPYGIRLSLQEYFEKLGTDPSRWGKPFSALLGAFKAQQAFYAPAIGGKDSMSGSFNDLDVPPSLISFAVQTTNDSEKIISPEFKETCSQVILIPLTCDIYEVPDFEELKISYTRIYRLIKEGSAISAQTVGQGGIAAAVSKMCFGNNIGITFTNEEDVENLFAPDLGSIILEMKSDLNEDDVYDLLEGISFEYLGKTTSKPLIKVNNNVLELSECLQAWTAPLEPVFPTQTPATEEEAATIFYIGRNNRKPLLRCSQPQVFIPVFPGTNCEYDTARAFEAAGAKTVTRVFRNLTPQAIEESIEVIVKEIKNSQIIALPGGFSAGDEPDGSGKFIASIFRNPYVKEAVHEHLKNKDGLMLGICNGFQVLVKLGLVPYGEIRDLDADSPTLTFNKIGRHISCLAQTKIVSTLSPWFCQANIGDVYNLAFSHGEGRFVAPQAVLDQLFANGQVATQYVDFSANVQGGVAYDPTKAGLMTAPITNGKASMNIEFNPNGSMMAIEGITSPDGHVLGKMGHSERTIGNVAQNVPGNKIQPIFTSGVEYFK